MSAIAFLNLPPLTRTNFTVNSIIQNHSPINTVSGEHNHLSMGIH